MISMDDHDHYNMNMTTMITMTTNLVSESITDNDVAEVGIFGLFHILSGNLEIRRLSQHAQYTVSDGDHNDQESCDKDCDTSVSLCNRISYSILK